jgi:hypothetical protein
MVQRLKDSIHNVLFVIGGFIGAYSGQFWYKCLSRLFLFIEWIVILIV